VSAAVILAAAGVACSPPPPPEPHPGMVLVPAGAFLMGSTQEQIERAERDYGGGPDLYRPEYPQRRLELPAFWIDRTEVTNAAYHAFVTATGHRLPEEAAVWATPYRWTAGGPPPALWGHPVTLVSAHDAEAYCAWRGLGLPTEEQWEKAARGTDGRTYPWGERPASWRVAGAERRSPVPLDHIERWTDWWRATYRDQMRGNEVGTFPAGTFPHGASPWGALDMAGNVFEWVAAEFAPYPGSSFTHPEFGQGYRVVRGGDWYLDRIWHRAAARLRAPPDHRVPTIGFRCACAVPGDAHAAPIAVLPAWRDNPGS
jgi:formylglycine-generating enzyme required for sulfatase activity